VYGGSRAVKVTRYTSLPSLSSVTSVGASETEPPSSAMIRFAIPWPIWFVEIFMSTPSSVRVVSVMKAFLSPVASRSAM